MITGITGHDGPYLSELLLENGYKVHGNARRASTLNTSRLEEIYSDPHSLKHNLHLHYGDLADRSNLARLIGKIQPAEVYNLGAPGVGLDWQKYAEIDPSYYRPAEVELLIGDASKAKRKIGWEPKTKFKDLIEVMVDAGLALLQDQRMGRVRPH